MVIGVFVEVVKLATTLGLEPSAERLEGSNPSLDIMYYVYILYSNKDGKLYVGLTNDLKRRINKHSNGLVRSTKNRRPLRLIYYEAYFYQSDAKRRELFLKGGKGREELKIQLQGIFKKIGYNFY